MTPDKHEVVSMVLALEEVVRTDTMGPRGLRFLCKESARLIRSLRPDLSFVEAEDRDTIGEDGDQSGSKRGTAAGY